MNEKDRISYYSLGGEIAQQYLELDNFLKLTDRYSRTAVIKNKITVCSVTGIIGLVLTIAFFCQTQKNLGLLLVAVIMFAAAIIFGAVYGSSPFEDVVRCENILDHDGIDKVYADFKSAKLIPQTNVYLGDIYLFGRSNTMCRLCDVQNIFIDHIESDDTTEYYIAAKITDETGTFVFNIAKVSGLAPEAQDAELLTVRYNIEQRRFRLMDMSQENDTIQ